MLAGDAFANTGDWPAAADQYRRVRELDPASLDARSRLGQALVHLGHCDEAAGVFRPLLATTLRADAEYGLGMIATRENRFDEAAEHFRRAVTITPTWAMAHNALGSALSAAGRPREAADAFRAAVALAPQQAEIHANLGDALRTSGRLDEAIATLRHAAAINPASAFVQGHLGDALLDAGQAGAACDALRRAAALDPKSAPVAAALAHALHSIGRVDEAVTIARSAVAMDAQRSASHAVLADALRDQGEGAAAAAEFRRAVELSPHSSSAHGQLLYAMWFAESEPAAIAAEHRRWAEGHAAPFAVASRSWANTRDPDRRLRVGYLSPDFRRHAVGRMIEPVLGNHDHSRFEIVCYDDGVRADEMTDVICGHADRWTKVTDLSDAELAARIEADQVDILVDLTLHMTRGRPLVMAKKPAPVLVNYLAYPGTSGLPQMDWRVTDPFLDPPGSEVLPDGSPFGPERLLRLPHTYYCYRPPSEAPAVTPLPAESKGYVTFGSFNNFSKTTDATLTAWARVLHATPGSRLLVVVAGGEAGNTAARRRIERFGVPPGRLTLWNYQPIGEYLRLVGSVDIALDTFPYAGGVTTLDGLWMGVPTVTLAGQTPVGRGGVSLLSNVGLGELIAGSVDEYVTIATSLASDLPRLGGIRQSLRPRMAASPVTDAAGFAHALEAAYRQMWREWTTQTR